MGSYSTLIVIVVKMVISYGDSKMLLVQLHTNDTIHTRMWNCGFVLNTSRKRDVVLTSWAL